jgi:predicted dehydrogenase
MTQYNWGILGTGNISHKFAQGLQDAPGAKLYCVASRSKQKAKEFAEKYGIPKYYGSYEELAKDPSVQIVYIATIHPLHCENTLLCLDQKKAVLCEKPFAMNAGDVKRMIASAKKNNTFLMEALWTNFLPSIKKVRELLYEKVLGELVSIKAEFGFLRPFDNVHRFFKPELGGGSLLEIGIYPIFLSLLLLGYPDNCSAHSILSPTGTDLSTGIFLSWKSGQFAQLTSSFSVELDNEAVIYCTKGKIKLHKMFHMPTKLSIIKNDETTEIPITWKGNGYNYEAEEVMQCLAKKQIESPSLAHEFSLTLMHLLETILKEKAKEVPKPEYEGCTRRFENCLNLVISSKTLQF